MLFDFRDIKKRSARENPVVSFFFFFAFIFQIPFIRSRHVFIFNNFKPNLFWNSYCCTGVKAPRSGVRWPLVTHISNTVQCSNYMIRQELFRTSILLCVKLPIALQFREKGVWVQTQPPQVSRKRRATNDRQGCKLLGAIRPSFSVTKVLLLSISKWLQEENIDMNDVCHIVLWTHHCFTTSNAGQFFW